MTAATTKTDSQNRPKSVKEIGKRNDLPRRTFSLTEGRITMPKIYGYARCSLAEERGQDLNRQCRELKAAGAEDIITEREHGDASRNTFSWWSSAPSRSIAATAKWTPCRLPFCKWLQFSVNSKKVYCGLVCVQGSLMPALKATGSAASPLQRKIFLPYSTSIIHPSRRESSMFRSLRGCAG